jgi:hypothetical protein
VWVSFCCFFFKFFFFFCEVEKKFFFNSNAADDAWQDWHAHAFAGLARGADGVDGAAAVDAADASDVGLAVGEAGGLGLVCERAARRPGDAAAKATRLERPHAAARSFVDDERQAADHHEGDEGPD